MEHTKEPWRVECEKFEKGYHNPNAWPRLFSGDFEICGAEGFYSDSLKQDKANARRIVACVNALAHVATEELESGRLQSIVQRAADAEKQRDELYAKVADTELALFAENQKRQDVERQRDALLVALESLIDMDVAYQRGEKVELAVEAARDAIQQVRSKE